MVGVIPGEGRADGLQRHDVDAGCHEVGLEQVVDRGRTARTEFGHGVVGPRERPVRIHGTDGDGVGGIPGRRQAHHNRSSVVTPAHIAGRRHDDDAGADHALHGLAQGIVPIRLEDRMPQRQVDHPDVVAVAFGNGPVDRLDDVAGAALPLGVEHLEADEVRIRGHANRSTVGVFLRHSGNDARDMSAVTVTIQAQAAAGKVHPDDDAVFQGRMPGQARVDDGHANAAARGGGQFARPAPRLVGAHDPFVESCVGSHDGISGHGRQRPILREALQLFRRHFQYGFVFEEPPHGKAMSARQFGDGLALPAHDDPRAPRRTAREMAFQICRQAGAVRASPRDGGDRPEARHGEGDPADATGRAVRTS